MNPLLGAAFCAIYGATVLFDVVTRRLPPVALLEQPLTVVPVLLGLWWCFASGMGDTAGSHLSFGWLFDAKNSPVLTLFLSLGGLLIPAALGCLRWRGLDFRPIVPAVAGVVVGLCLLYLVWLTDRSWVGFRAGNVLQVTLPLLAARGLAGLWDSGRRSLATIGIAVILLTASPTTLIDTYNAQDITNLRMGPGFPWTITLSPAQQAGCDWLRKTPPRTVVQADPLARDRQNWSIIPTFAGRRMAVGQALPSAAGASAGGRQGTRARHPRHAAAACGARRSAAPRHQLPLVRRRRRQRKDRCKSATLQGRPRVFHAGFPAKRRLHLSRELIDHEAIRLGREQGFPALAAGLFSPYNSRVRILFVQNNGIQESIGIANLSGILKANGHETDLLLVSHTPDLIGAITRYDPGLIAFSALTGVHHSLEQLAVQIKQR